MNIGTKILIGVGIVGVIAVSFIGAFNNFVKLEANVESSLSNIDTQYQRRADLIPQLVQTVEQAVTSERKTLDDVVSARAAATNVSLGDGASIAEYQAAQQELSAGIGKLIAISEAYPELKSTEGFRDLQAQLEGTENRIAVARQDYNAAAKKYNVAISTFPSVLAAGMFGHSDKVEFFKAEAGAEKAPVLEFKDSE